MTRKLSRRPSKQQKSLRLFPLETGLPALTSVRAEVIQMRNVLLGRESPPVDRGVMTLMEVADAYFARSAEIKMMIQEMELDGRVSRGSGWYRFRTGELATFMEICKRASELGSRRITVEQLRFEASKTGRDSKFNY